MISHNSNYILPIIITITIALTTLNLNLFSLIARAAETISVDKMNYSETTKLLTNPYALIPSSSTRPSDAQGQASPLFQMITIIATNTTNVTANKTCYNSVYNNYNISNNNCSSIPDYARSPPPLNHSTSPPGQ